MEEGAGVEWGGEGRGGGVQRGREKGWRGRVERSGGRKEGREELGSVCGGGVSEEG